MAEINDNIIIDGITLTLRKNYPEAQISAEKINQGLKAPAFVVSMPTSQQIKDGQNRWRRLNRVDVMYFPKKENRRECRIVAEELYKILDYINTSKGDLIRGTSISYEIVDNILHFMVSYDYSVNIERNTERMEDLGIKQGG